MSVVMKSTEIKALSKRAATKRKVLLTRARDIVNAAPNQLFQSEDERPRIDKVLANAIVAVGKYIRVAPKKKEAAK